MYYPEFEIKTKEDIISCIKNFESLAYSKGNSKYGVKPYIYSIPFIRDNEGCLFVLGSHSGQTVLFSINKNKTINSQKSGFINDLDKFISDNFFTIANNISKPKMVSVVINAFTGEVIDTLKLYNEKSDLIKVSFNH